MEKVVVFSDRFHQSIEELIEILFVKEYFGYKVDCHRNTDKIYDFIKDNIDLPISKSCPENFRRLGKKYLRYKANQNTYWYIFFDEKDNKYIVNHILNNHSTNFPELL